MSETYLILGRAEQDIAILYIGLHVKYILLFSVLMKHEFSRQIFEKYSNFIKIRPTGADLFRADGRMQRQTDGRAEMMKLIVTFRNFENAPKIAGIQLFASVQLL